MRLRWISAGYILIAVVLSNAYKSNNINNMIANRAPLPYSQFQDLVEDNFQIHTRSVGHYVVKPPNQWSPQDSERLILKIRPHSIHEFNKMLMGLFSEVSALASHQSNWARDNSSQVEKLREIEKFSSLHQSLPNIMRDSYFRGNELCLSPISIVFYCVPLR